MKGKLPENQIGHKTVSRASFFGQSAKKKQLSLSEVTL